MLGSCPEAAHCQRAPHILRARLSLLVMQYLCTSLIYPANDKHDDAVAGSVYGPELCLLGAVLCLAAAQKLHTVSGPLRTASCALWGLLGAPKLASKEFSALAVKNIQLTSVTGTLLTCDCLMSPPDYLKNRNLEQSSS